MREIGLNSEDWSYLKKEGSMDALTQPSPILLQALFDDSAARHKHLCPRQVLGARLGLAGLLALSLPNVYDERFDNGRKHLLTIVETDGCAVCGEEIINEREVVVDGRFLCHSCAGDVYYRF